MRVDLSNLCKHKFKHSFQDTLNPICSCGEDIETTSHYLLHCPDYLQQRMPLLNTVSCNAVVTLLNTVSCNAVVMLLNTVSCNAVVTLLNTVSCNAPNIFYFNNDSLTEILLYGKEDLDNINNTSILDAIINYLVRLMETKGD